MRIFVAQQHVLPLLRHLLQSHQEQLPSTAVEHLIRKISWRYATIFQRQMDRTRNETTNNCRAHCVVDRIHSVSTEERVENWVSGSSIHHLYEQAEVGRNKTNCISRTSHELNSLEHESIIDDHNGMKWGWRTRIWRWRADGRGEFYKQQMLKICIWRPIWDVFKASLVHTRKVSVTFVMDIRMHTRHDHMWMIIKARNICTGTRNRECSRQYSGNLNIGEILGKLLYLFLCLMVQWTDECTLWWDCPLSLGDDMISKGDWNGINIRRSGIL